MERLRPKSKRFVPATSNVYVTVWNSGTIGTDFEKNEV